MVAPTVVWVDCSCGQSFIVRILFYRKGLLKCFAMMKFSLLSLKFSPNAVRLKFSLLSLKFLLNAVRVKFSLPSLKFSPNAVRVKFSLPTFFFKRK